MKESWNEKILSKKKVLLYYKKFWTRTIDWRISKRLKYKLYITLFNNSWCTK